MAQSLLQNKIAIDQFVSSPARRAKKTAKLFIKEFGKDESEILFIPELYHASVETFIKVISSLDDEHAAIAIFSHNPGITEYVNTLTEIQIDNMPTCGIFAVKAEIDSWSLFAEARKDILFFNYPKMQQK